MIQKLNYLLIIALIILISMSFHPFIVQNSEMEMIEKGTILNPYIIRLFMLIVMISFINHIINKKRLISHFKYIFCAFLTILFFSLLALGIFNSSSMFSDSRAIAIILASVYIGYQMSMTKKQFYLLLIIFCITTFYVSLLQIFINGQGFVILQTYDVTQKNSLGSLVATSIVIGYWFFHYSNHLLPQRFLGIFLMIVGFVIILTIRARTAALASLVVCFFMFFMFHKHKNLTKSFILCTLLFFFALIFIPDFVYQYVVDSFILGREDDITTGRVARIVPVLHFLSTNLWLGNLNSNIGLGIVHIFCLFKIYQYGIIFSMPILILYFYFPIFDYKCISRINNYPYELIGLFALIIPYIISTQEYTFPFGPGTATVFNYILFGYSLQNMKLQNEIS